MLTELLEKLADVSEKTSTEEVTRTFTKLFADERFAGPLKRIMKVGLATDCSWQKDFYRDILWSNSRLIASLETDPTIVISYKKKDGRYQTSHEVIRLTSEHIIVGGLVYPKSKAKVIAAALTTWTPKSKALSWHLKDHVE